MKDILYCPYCGNCLCGGCCCQMFKGEQGRPGVKGDKGDRGEQGMKGEKGDKGEPGAVGERGERGEQGIQGDRGEQGEKGDRGEQGVQGEKGDPGINFAVTNMSAIHTGGITLDVVESGIAIPLNGTRVLNGFTTSTPYTQFTVGESGIYYITYSIKTVTAVTLRTRIVRNGAPLSGSNKYTSVPDTNYVLSILAPLSAGDVISLEIYGYTGSVRIQGGTGAALVLIRLN